MAKTTNAQKQSLRSNGILSDKIDLELLVEAAYWSDYVAPNVGQCNRANRKRKDYAQIILSNAGINLQTAVNHFVMIYDADPPQIEIDGSVTDAHVTQYFPKTYDFLAGVLPGDAQIPLL